MMVKIGLIQMSSSPNKSENLEKAIGYVREAASQGAKIICLQELFSTQYFCVVQDTRYFSLAEPIPGPTTERLAEEARRNNVAIIAPIFEEDGNVAGTYYNTAAVIDHDGRLLGKYRKTHIPQLHGYNEKFYFKPGNLGYPVFEDFGCKFGVIICYDRHFEEGPRIEALHGAEVVFVPTCTGFYPELWELELRAHAAFNTIFVGGVNRCGVEFPEQPSQYYGKSLVINPRGEVLSQAGEDESVLVVDVDLDEVKRRRQIAPFLRDRRPELYGDLTKHL